MGRKARKFGERGEWLASLYLRLKGYKILEKNFRTRLGEIDLIVEKGGTLAFVEVKSRSSDAFGSPVEAVDSRKRRRIADIASLYLASRRQSWDTVRFDVVSISKGRFFPYKIEHLKSAFDGDW